MASTAGARPVCAVLLLLSGCSASEPAVAPRTPASPPARSATSESGFGGRPARVEVRSQAVTLPLPDSSRWRGETFGSWSVLLHDATRSTLYVKQWPAARLVRAGECLTQARFGQRAMIILRDEEIVDRREVMIPPGVDGDVVVGVRDVGAELHGYAEMSAAGIGRCLVVTFHTVAQGRGREEEVAQRLATIADNVFAQVRPQVVEDRVAR